MFYRHFFESPRGILDSRVSPQRIAPIVRVKCLIIIGLLGAEGPRGA
jgi:hypothetical protein